MLSVLAAAILMVIFESELAIRDERAMRLRLLLMPAPLSRRKRAALRSRPVDTRTTVVTGFFELPRGGSMRERYDGTRYVITSDRYWQWARRILSFRSPMVVFTTPRVAGLVSAFREELGLSEATRVVTLNTRAWLARPEFAMMRELLIERGLDRASQAATSAVRMQPALRAVYRRVPPWLVRAVGVQWSADVSSPEATDVELPPERVAAAAARAGWRKTDPLPADAALAAHWSKVFWVLDAMRRDPFESENFMWIDWGLLRGDRRDDAFMHRAWPGPRAQARFEAVPRMHYIQYSLAFNALCRPPSRCPGVEPTFGVSAGAFGGPREPLKQALELIVAYLRADLARGVVVEEETSMTRVLHRRPDLFACANPVLPLVVPRPHYSCVTEFMY